MDPDDLAGFLKARLDEDEAAANAAGGDSWRASESGVYHEDAANFPGPFAVGPYEYLEDDERAHIARHDPARALREVKAKRSMLEDLDLTYPDEEHLLKLLAAVYSDHPDYRQEWKP